MSAHINQLFHRLTSSHEPYAGGVGKESSILCPLSQFNFVGKLLGPRGNSMKRLQEETGVKMSILGKGSMRDKGKVREILICVEI